MLRPAAARPVTRSRRPTPGRAIPRERCRHAGQSLTIAAATAGRSAHAVRADGVNFAVFSRHAQRVHLVLFEEGHEEPFAEIPLDPSANKTGDVWHVFVHGLPPDCLYGYRVDGPFAPQCRASLQLGAVLLDPYARGPERRPSVGASRQGRRRQPAAAPRPGRRRRLRLGRATSPPATPLAQTVIYELHVRGFTRHPSSGVQHPGTFLGLCEKIPLPEVAGRHGRRS